LVIAPYIENRSTSELFQPLDGVLNRRLTKSDFYADLLATGRRNNRQLFLPVSFHLPLVYYQQDVPPFGEHPIITPEEMMNRAEGFNRGTGTRWLNLAYSPAWSPEFLYHYARAQGVDFTEGPDGAPEWSQEELDKVMQSAKEWIETASGSAALDREFAERYLYTPELELVRQGRIAYGFSTSAEFLSLPESMRPDLQFRWLGHEGTVPVLENVIFAGIPQGANNVPGAHDFFEFLFSAENQTLLIEDALRKQVDGFGVAGGFSSLWKVTEREMGRFYPKLRGHVPPDESLRFPPPSPRHWGELLPEIVIPWLQREVNGSVQPRSLQSLISAWLLQQEE
jgi:ABC-type glycerol-3-phosphate transport system substrate-binding protein